MEIAALVISIIALIAAIGSFWYTRRQAHGTEAQAAEARRANDRLEAIDAAAAEEARLEAERNLVNWTFVGNGRNAYMMRNQGTARVRNVVLQATEAVLRVEGAEDLGNRTFRLTEVRPGRPVTLTFVPAADYDSTETPKLTIDWDGNEDGPQAVPFPDL